MTQVYKNSRGLKFPLTVLCWGGSKHGQIITVCEFRFQIRVLEPHRWVRPDRDYPPTAHYRVDEYRIERLSLLHRFSMCRFLFPVAMLAGKEIEDLNRTGEVEYLGDELLSHLWVKRWAPPKGGRFTCYGPEDECWMRPLGLGKMVQVPLTDTKFLPEEVEGQISFSVERLRYEDCCP